MRNKFKTENLEVTEEANVDEAVKFCLQKESKTKSYKKTMKIDIDTINTFENRNKVYTTQWRKIYKVIEPDYFKEFDIFPDDFIKQCNDNSNEAINIPIEVKNNINRMAMEQGLYAQLVMISRKDLKFIAEDKNKTEAKLNFQGQSARSQRLFDIDFDCVEVNFITREPNLYRKLSPSHDDTQDTNTFKFFQVPIGNSKCVESFKFHNDAPISNIFRSR